MRNYQRFMLDYMNEHSPEMMPYVNLDEMDDEEDYFANDARDENNNPVYKEGYVFRDQLQSKYITPALAKNRVQDQILQFTSDFRESHVTQLSTSGPVYTFTFGQKEIKPIYDLFSIDGDTLIQIYNEMVQDTYFGKISKFFTGWVENAPHKILMTSILVDAFQNNYPYMIECMEYLYAFTEYPILYRKYWKTGVREDVMNYTIEHLGPKFKVKQVKNLRDLLKYDTTTAVEFYKDQLTKGVDNVYIDLMYRIRNSMNNKFKNIENEYYKNVAENKTQHNTPSEYDDGEKPDQEGDISAMANIIDQTINKFYNGEINNAIARMAAQGGQVDTSNLIGMISAIYSTKHNRIPKFVENILTYYFKSKNTSEFIASEFLNFGLSTYRSIGNSTDPLLVEIKSIQDFWMNDIIDIMSKYPKGNTSKLYRRAIYNYMIMMINYYQ